METVLTIFHRATVSLDTGQQVSINESSHTLSVVGKSSLSKLPPYARFLVTTEWKCKMQSIVGVDPDGTSPQPVGGIHCQLEILCMDGSSQPKSGVVSELNDFLEVLELGDRGNRAEDLEVVSPEIQSQWTLLHITHLFLHDLHVRPDIGEDSWLDEVPLVSKTLSTDFNLSTITLTVVNITNNFVRILHA